MRLAFVGASLGPGLLLAATSIGASHLLMSPEAGARFEYHLLWLVLAVHALKYPAFEFAPRYVAARGESLLSAYARAGRWALWLGLGDMTIQAVGLIAALVGLTASFLVISVGGLSLVAWSLVLTLALLLLLAFGRYRALRAINIFLLMILAVGTVIALVGAPPAPGQGYAGSWRERQRAPRAASNGATPESRKRRGTRDATWAGRGRRLWRRQSRSRPDPARCRTRARCTNAGTS